MNRNLEAARRDYDMYFADVVDRLLGLSPEELESLSFAEIAVQIQDSAIRREYQWRAIQLLEENLRDHFIDRPSALKAWRSRNSRELRDWQTVASEWELELLNLVSQSDT